MTGQRPRIKSTWIGVKLTGIPPPSNKLDAGGSNPPTWYCHTLSVAYRTMLRKALAAALIITATAVTKDQSKEKMIEVVKDGRRKLANWIQPKDTRPIV